MKKTVEKTALYRFYNGEGVLLYVGVSLYPLSRLSQHSTASDWFGSVEIVKVEWHETRDEAYNAECLAIYKEKPIHNKNIGIDRLDAMLCQTTELWGNPLTHRGKVRKEFIKVRVTEEELHAAEAVAKARGTTVSQLLREHLARLQTVDAKRADQDRAAS